MRNDGSPVHYDWSTQGTKKAAAAINFNGATAMIDLRVDGARPFTQQFTFSSQPIVVLDNNLYHQYAVLARLYDWNKKGAQTFSVLVPQEMTPGSVTVESLGAKDIEGKKLDELQVKTEDLELDLYLENQRLVRIDAPNANAEIIREYFHTLETIQAVRLQPVPTTRLTLFYGAAFSPALFCCFKWSR